MRQRSGFLDVKQNLTLHVQLLDAWNISAGKFVGYCTAELSLRENNALFPAISNR